MKLTPAWIAMFRLHTTGRLSPNRPSLYYKKYEFGISSNTNVSSYTLVNLLFAIPLERTLKMVMHSRGCNDSNRFGGKSLEDLRDPSPAPPHNPHPPLHTEKTKVTQFNWKFFNKNCVLITCTRLRNISAYFFFGRQRIKNFYVRTVWHLTVLIWLNFWEITFLSEIKLNR